MVEAVLDIRGVIVDRGTQREKPILQKILIQLALICVACDMPCRSVEWHSSESRVLHVE